MLQVFDASSMIYAWDNYPNNQFPGLWKWLGTQVNQHQLLMSQVAFMEVQHKTPDCAEWLQSHNLGQLQIANSILQDARRIKNLLGIVGDQYGSGVGENDLFIIATAKQHNAELVSDENRQNNLPGLLKNYKIPAVCELAYTSFISGFQVRQIVDYLSGV
jgi:predicted nucleic acid-binding protein